MKFYATAARGIAPLLAEELRALGAEMVQPATAGVSFQGPLECAYRACLWSRLASRILLPLTDVDARDGDALYAGIRELHWERHLRSDGTLAVDCTGSRAAIGHSKFAALRVKDAVVDRFRERFGERPSVDTETPDLRINVLLRGETARVSIDLSGQPLHRRGYRTSGGAAPLKENLAAAILTLAGWPGVAARGGALLDPMCGSGTLVTEAALMAGDCAPGLLREYFGFLGWKRHEAHVWQRLLEEAAERREAGREQVPVLYGYDRDPRALAAAGANVTAAGVDDSVILAQRPLAADMPLPGADVGLLVTNPPYGERLGGTEDLRRTYALIGELLRTRLPDWQAAVFTGNPELAAAIGLKPEHSTTLFNGPLECRLLTYPAAGSRAPGPGAQTLDETGRAFANRLKKNIKHLSRWARRESVDCYRVYDQDIPEFAVAVDLYQGAKRWVHVQEYAPPRAVDPLKAGERLEQAMLAIGEVLEVPPSQVFLKVRRRQKGRAQYGKLAETGRFYEVAEWNCRLLVNFTDYLDTGLFLDHRLTRRMVQARAAGRRVLNLFCYTGTATVHAVRGGAAQTTSVDLSRTYLDWAERNLRLNGAEIGDAHRIVQADCRQWLLQEARRGNRRFELIFMDPPTFSASKRMDGTLDIQRDHVELIRNAMAVLSHGGELIFSNNFRRFTLDQQALAEFIVEDISGATIPEDFRRRPDIHRCWLIRHR